jgi:hypothetical protein
MSFGNHPDSPGIESSFIGWVLRLNEYRKVEVLLILAGCLKACLLKYRQTLPRLPHNHRSCCV